MVREGTVASGEVFSRGGGAVGGELGGRTHTRHMASVFGSRGASRRGKRGRGK